MNLSEILGAEVRDTSGRRIGRIRDLGVLIDTQLPVVSSVWVGRGEGRRVGWDEVSIPTLPAVVLRAGFRPARPVARELRLAGDVLDRQVFDSRGKRLSRVADVALTLAGGRLEVVAVETGAAGIARRLGLRRLAARFRPSLVDWRELHLLSGRGHALQLDSSAAGVHRLEPVHLVELVRRAPHRRGVEVLGRVHPARAEHTRALLASAARRRRSSDPLAARKRAPS